MQIDHGLTRQDGRSTYTDVDGDQLTVSAIDDNNGTPVVAIELDAEGNLVHIDVAHVEDFIEAVREKAAEARASYGEKEN